MTSNRNLQTAVQNFFAMQDGGGGAQGPAAQVTFSYIIFYVSLVFLYDTFYIFKKKVCCCNFFCKICICLTCFFLWNKRLILIFTPLLFCPC